MIIFLYGPDSYRRREKLNEILGEYRKKHSDLALERFNLDETGGFARLQEFISSHSIFGSVKTAVVSGIFSSKKNGAVNKKEIKKFLESYLKTEDAILLVSEDNEPLKDFEFLLEKPVLSQKFLNLDGERLNFFIKKEAQKRGLSLTPATVIFLANNFKGDTWGLITELDKISLAGRKSFDVKDLREFGDFRKSPDISRFINLFIRQSVGVPRKITDLENLFIRREEPAKIFNFLASTSRSSRLLNRMADYDVAIKSSRLGYDEALLGLALE